MTAPNEITPMATIENEIIDEFQFFDDWTDKYTHIIEMGEELPNLEEEHKIDLNLVPGCQSRVWLVSTPLPDDRIEYRADSDASITRGLIALLVKVLNKQKKSEIVQSKLEFINQIGLGKHLSPSRANGFANMIKKMKEHAAR